MDGAEELSGSVRECPELYAQWLQCVARNLYTWRLDRGAPDASNFQIRGRVRSVEGFTIVRAVTKAGKCTVRRDAPEIAADGQDRYGLYMSLRGGLAVSQFGRSQLIKPGSYSLARASDPSSYSKFGRNDAITFLMPREFVDPRVTHGERICARPAGAMAALTNLVFETVHAFERNSWDMTKPEFRQSAQVVAELVVLALNGPIDTSSNEQPVRIANLGRVKRIIRRRLSDPDLTLAEVADEAGLSLSYVHELFRHAGDGLTMREYLTNVRLQRAHELLILAKSRKMTITYILSECGFSSSSYFSTAFKRAFGRAPRDVLRATSDESLKL